MRSEMLVMDICNRGSVVQGWSFVVERVGLLTRQLGTASTALHWDLSRDQSVRMGVTNTALTDSPPQWQNIKKFGELIRVPTIELLQREQAGRPEFGF